MRSEERLEAGLDACRVDLAAARASRDPVRVLRVRRRIARLMADLKGMLDGRGSGPGG